MSGSPIYVDGKLVGALAYGWPFSREPICGITPIQSMLDIRKAPAGASRSDRRRGDAAPPQFVVGVPGPRRSRRRSTRCCRPAQGASRRPRARRRCRCRCRFSGRPAPGSPLRSRWPRPPAGWSRRRAASAGSPRHRATAGSPDAGPPPRAGLGGRRRAPVGRHGPVGDGHRDVGRRQLDPGLRPSRSSRWARWTCRWRRPTS